jgi:hypothetical protein
MMPPSGADNEPIQTGPGIAPQLASAYLHAAALYATG